MDLAAVSKVMQAATSRPVDAAASIAAWTSSSDDIVSTHRQSAPPSARASACSVNAARASS
jgi:hypothetical protein